MRRSHVDVTEIAPSPAFTSAAAEQTISTSLLM
jgi:hypothetical protein